MPNCRRSMFGSFCSISRIVGRRRALSELVVDEHLILTRVINARLTGRDADDPEQ